ncbi:Arc family DNA-binding protein [Stenotrophomonas maltophilia]|nr:Arc family DNA-binding protein [Stenotrophomonas maltophilia]MBN5008564.1 Arc family DNA-binding protein [Stenotrophomonas maltophilia]
MLSFGMAKKDDQQTNVRLPTELKERITKAAQDAGRSFTAELVLRLEASFESVLEASLLQARTAERQALADEIARCDHKLAQLRREIEHHSTIDPVDAEAHGIADDMAANVAEIITEQHLIEAERARLVDYLSRVNGDISVLANGLQGKLTHLRAMESSPWPPS